MGPFKSILAISLGASLGASLRWGLGLWLNARWELMPLGTLAANLLGGYLIGVAGAALALRPDLPPEVRLMVVTGFLGGLTTFSTFSAEVTGMLQEGRLTPALLTISAHLLGSLGMTVLGMATLALIQRQ